MIELAKFDRFEIAVAAGIEGAPDRRQIRLGLDRSILAAVESEYRALHSPQVLRRIHTREVTLPRQHQIAHTLFSLRFRQFGKQFFELTPKCRQVLNVSQ